MITFGAPRGFSSHKLKIFDKMNELSYIPELREFVMAHGFLAGGAVRDLIRDKAPKDWDIFFKSEAAKDEFIRKFSHRFSATGVGNYNYRDFQFITIRFGSPQQVIDTFDWTVNMAYYDFASEKLFSYNSSDYLYINPKSEKPLSALIRLPYMLEKGFKIEEKELLYAISFVSQVVDMRSTEAVEKQHEFMSAGGFQASIYGVVERATQEAVNQSPLMKALR